MSSKKDFLGFAEKFIHGSGLGPLSPKYKRFISLWLLLPNALIVDFFVIYDFCFVRNDILKAAELLESISSFGQLIIRKFILTVHGKLIQDILRQRQQLWDYDLFGKKYGLYLHDKMVLATRVIKIMLSLGTTIASLMCLSALLDDDKKVPLESWTPENKLLSYVFYIMQLLSLAEIIYLVGAVDAFYVLMCVDLKIQFLLLRRKIRSIRLSTGLKEKCFNDLKSCIEHHNLLLRMHKKVNRVFSEYFLVQYAVSVLAACVQLYILMYITTSLQDMLKSIVYLGAVFFQVGMFFLPASDIEEEAEKLAVEIYDVNWEFSGDGKIRRQILFMLMKAQEPLCMMGGGMVHANRNEYVVLFKLAFSIATLLGGMNENGKINK